jgi:hypothetical protein
MMSEKQRQKWQAKIDNAKSLQGLRVVAEDLIVAVGVDYDGWMKKIENARTLTQLQIVCEDLLAIV